MFSNKTRKSCCFQAGPDVDQMQQRKRFYGLQFSRAASQRWRKKQNENGKNMNPYMTLDQPNRIAQTKRKTTRSRLPLPPLQARDWMTANETALALGCSTATIHRLRRGVISGVEPLPCSQYGRKCVSRKPSVALPQMRHSII